MAFKKKNLHRLISLPVFSSPVCHLAYWLPALFTFIYIDLDPKTSTIASVYGKKWKDNGKWKKHIGGNIDENNANPMIFFSKFVKKHDKK